MDFPTNAHPKSHKISWLDEKNDVWVKKQALVSFHIGGYMDHVWCDIVPMTTCSLFLGRPWQSDRNVIHHGRDNVYLVPKHAIISHGNSVGNFVSTSLAADEIEGKHTCLS